MNNRHEQDPASPERPAIKVVRLLRPEEFDFLQIELAEGVTEIGESELKAMILRRARRTAEYFELRDQGVLTPEEAKKLYDDDPRYNGPGGGDGSVGI